MSDRSKEQEDLRRHIVSYVCRDLLGPDSENESLSERPEDWYLLGILWPSDAEVEEADTEEDLGADEETSDATTAGYGGMKQSAVGLTIVVPAGSTAPLDISVRYGTYERVHDPLNKTSRWHRTQHAETVPWMVDARKEADRELPLGAALVLRARERKGNIFLTASLVNRNVKKTTGRSLFQPEIVIATPDPAKTPFVVVPHAELSVDDRDVDSDRLLYRNVREYAIGHGCAVRWGADTSVTTIRSVTTPQSEVPAVVPLEASAAELGMQTLAEIEGGDALAAALLPLADEYDAWIARQSDAAAALDTIYRATAHAHLTECTDAALRIRAGIHTLRADERVADAFRYANAAMALQRDQTRRAVANREGRRLGKLTASRWRPFQLAFFLLNIPALVDPDDSGNGMVDLLWFPTGGGKTEAYLGLTAFSLFLRRSGFVPPGTDGSCGLNVIMRYTLRLLTTQQFERAAALICACEDLRKADPQRWGAGRFTIGMWVGATTTPNAIGAASGDQEGTARDFLRKLDTGEKLLENHPFVLRTCPWCGAKLGRASFAIDESASRLCIACPSKDCAFSAPHGLPVLVVDDEIYRYPPSLLIGTVDKFARLPWVPDAATLFGHATVGDSHGGIYPAKEIGTRGRGVLHAIEPPAPPRLIIQDELHLISGPLGSLVGLYETAVDFLCTRRIAGRTYRPKVIASTATIRRASDQVRGVFARDVIVFPPAALDPFDSFFARPAPPTERSGRLFVGLCPFGRSAKTTQVRLYSSLMRALTKFLDDKELIDPYWTIVSYFTSLGKLGGAVSLIEDDVNSRLGVLYANTGVGRPKADHVEVTSRVESTRIPVILGQMQQTAASGEAVDIILATNMISVGLDVGRLGLMVMNCQPKSTSEYIQASSRVGRESPGLVFTIYNWATPRDLSHYERFGAYHAALYRHVEATSVTPFAPRARDRALHAAAIAALRLTYPTLTGNRAAGSFSAADARAFIDFVRDRVATAETTTVEPEVEAARTVAELEAFVQAWETAANAPGAGAVVYHNKDRPTDVPLMVQAGPLARTPNAVTMRTLNSLRDVEASAEWQRIDE